MSLKTKIKNSIIRGLAPVSFFFYREKPRARVIALHDVPEKLQSNFEEKMEWLKTNFHVVSLEKLFSGDGFHDKRLNIALTFDDGFKEYATFVAPVLRRLSLPATFFISSGAWGNTKDFGRENLKRNGNFKFLSPEDVVSLANDPLFNIGGHTMNHIDLGKKIPALSLENEIISDKKNIENLIGKPILFFAYPFGSVKNIHTDSVSVIKKAGYRAAFTILPSFFSPKDSYSIGRDSLLLNDSNEVWNATLCGGYDSISRIKNLIFHR